MNWKSIETSFVGSKIEINWDIHIINIINRILCVSLSELFEILCFTYIFIVMYLQLRAFSLTQRQISRKICDVRRPQIRCLLSYDSYLFHIPVQ